MFFFFFSSSTCLTAAAAYVFITLIYAQVHIIIVYYCCNADYRYAYHIAQRTKWNTFVSPICPNTYCASHTVYYIPILLLLYHVIILKSIYKALTFWIYTIYLFCTLGIVWRANILYNIIIIGVYITFILYKPLNYSQKCVCTAS